MKKWTKTAGLIFMAAASVYADRAIAARPAKSASPADKANTTDVKLLEDNSDPFAAVAPSTAPSSNSGASSSNGSAVADKSASSSSGSTTPVSENKSPAAPIQANPDGTFSLNITAGADVVEQLRVIGFQAQESIIPSKEVHGTLPAMDLYNVTVHEALDALLHSNGYAWREKGKFIYVYSAKEIADQEKAARVASTEVFHLYYTPAQNAVTMIKPVLSGDAQVSFTTAATAGLQTGVSDVGGNSHATDDVIVVTDYSENLAKVRQVLKEVDRRPQQILIEATILSAKLSDNNSLGVDFNVVGGVDFTQLTHASGQISNAGLGRYSGNVPGDANPKLAGNTASSVGTGNNFSNIPGAFKVGVVTDNVSIFLSALEGVTDTTVLANPKVLALNKQKGEVIVGNKDGYITTTQTETSSTQTVEFLDTGTRLIFRPFIGDDGYIRMEIHPEDSSGGISVIGGQSLPHKSTTEVTSNVMVKDGHTVVIGGLFRDNSSRNRSQVPGLGNLPLAGALFRQQADATTRDEVIILLTPHIVKDDDAYSEMSEKELAEAEKLRVGVRKGMMFWGRERLAEMNYQWAVEEMNKRHPDRKKALWNLDCATNLNPKFVEAIRMKEELTGKEVTDVDNSSIRSFVKRAILQDRAPATQPAAEAAPAAGPSTAPVAQTSEPATQPTAAAPATQPVAAGATTQPAHVAAVEPDADLAMNEPSTAPASQPVASKEAAKLEATAEADKPQPTTAPAAHGEQDAAKEPAVTELPTQEIPAADASLPDANK